MNSYYNTTTPYAPHSTASSAAGNAEFAAVAEGFDQLPPLTDLLGDKWYCGTDTGAPNAYVLTVSDADTSLTDFMKVCIRIGPGNSGVLDTPSTLNFNGLGVRSIKMVNGTDPDSTYMVAGRIIEMRYDANNTCWVITSFVRT